MKEIDDPYAKMDLQWLSEGRSEVLYENGVIVGFIIHDFFEIFFGIKITLGFSAYVCERGTYEIAYRNNYAEYKTKNEAKQWVLKEISFLKNERVKAFREGQRKLLQNLTECG